MERKQGRLLTPIKKGQEPEFKYTPSCSTNIRETFERIRREQAEATKNVKPIGCIRRR